MHGVEHPRLTLRMAVAGPRKMSPEEQQRASDRLKDIYSLVTSTLEALAPGVPPFHKDEVLVSYYRGSRRGDGQALDAHAFPVLRLLSGLADGADQLAFRCLLDFEERAAASAEGPGQHTEYELVAVLPCEPIMYRANSKVENVVQFNELLGRCSSVIELDGICDPKSEDEGEREPPLVRRRRERCFVAQSRVLLRQCDVLIALLNSDSEGRAGGTRQTMLAAVDMRIPVIYVPVDSDIVAVIQERADLDQDLTAAQSDWKKEVCSALSPLLGDPEPKRAAKQTGASLKKEELEFLREFFGARSWRKPFRQKLWARFEKRFRRGDDGTVNQDVPIDYFRHYRSRASEISAYYAGKYRGSFLANYTLAAVAVFLAVSALVWVIFELHADPRRALSYTVLILLGLLKLVALIIIYLNTRHGNQEHLNDKAIDARYLAERLRTFYYLPLAGSLHAWAPRSARYAGRELREKVVSWLCAAIVRQAPAGAGLATAPAPPIHLWQPAPDRPAPIFYRIDPGEAARRIRENWLDTQIAYHQRQSRTQKRMYEWIEGCMSGSNLLVIGVVLSDLILTLALAAALVFSRKSDLLEVLHTWSPGLLFFAAVLPAVVASLNGLSFQSECKRIATRSEAVRSLLKDRKDEWDGFAKQVEEYQGRANDPGAWVLRALDLAESCAQIVTDEVAEWSALYSRDLTDI